MSKEKTEYQRFESEGDFQKALDRLLEQRGRELRVFDPDLKALRLNLPARVAQLENFLRANRSHRIYIVVHHTEHLTRQCPRMMELLKRFTHAIQINRTHEEIRNLQDAFLVLDAQHYLRRPVAERLRGAIGLHDETEALAMRSRFHEIWGASYPGVSRAPSSDCRFFHARITAQPQSSSHGFLFNFKYKRIDYE